MKAIEKLPAKGRKKKIRKAPKKWANLSDSEKDAVLRQLAERAGLATPGGD